ncbi:gamma-glutamylcyclotransferase [Polaromonas sp.]|uniref:gamma-glutamylcyclotransferase family protein n=1 Tax=Polaromonas sp. TaxID=1869339 RepID=UPI0037531492
MTAPATRHVFVYGTLRRGDVRDITRLQPAPQFAGMATVAGVLYDLGPYPGLRLGGEGRVTGEVYAISAELEQRLDEIEEVWPQQTGEYSKREVAVQMDGAPAAVGPLCLVYEVNASHLTGRAVIASGDWRRRTPGP